MLFKKILIAKFTFAEMALSISTVCDNNLLRRGPIRKDETDLNLVHGGVSHDKIN